GAHAHDVLEMQMGRVVEIDMRLRGVVDDEFESAGELRRDDPRDAAMVQMGLRMLGVFCARSAHGNEPTVWRSTARRCKRYPVDTRSKHRSVWITGACWVPSDHHRDGATTPH